MVVTHFVGETQIDGIKRFIQKYLSCWVTDGYPEYAEYPWVITPGRVGPNSEYGPNTK